MSYYTCTFIHSNYCARGYKHVHIHDKITSTASVHFLVYFVAVPGEKMIIIHSINYVTYHYFHVIMMNFYELTDCVLERLSLYGSKGRREREGEGERERETKRERKRDHSCVHMMKQIQQILTFLVVGRWRHFSLVLQC